MRIALFTALILVLSPLATADEGWTLTAADFRRSKVAVSSLDEKNIVLTPAGGAEITLPLDQVLRLDRENRAAAAAPKYTLFLNSGDRIGGQPGDLKDESLAWTSPAIGNLKLPMRNLRAISRLATPPGLDDERREDQVTLTNHDIVRGVISVIESGNIMIQTGGDIVPVPFNSADSILFASPAKTTAAAPRAFRIRFADGSVFTIPTVKISGGKLLLGLAGGEARPVDLAGVLGIEQLNGPVSWLSDRVPLVNEQVPFNSETIYPAKMNLNVFGKPLRYGAQSFERGIGVHANSTVVFAVDGSYRYFRTRYAIDTTSEVGKAQVDVRVLLDDRVVHEQKGVRAYTISPLLNIDLEGAKKLTLQVTAAGVTDTQDRVNWIEAAFVRAAPAEPKSIPAAAGSSIPATSPAATRPQVIP